MMELVGIGGQNDGKRIEDHGNSVRLLVPSTLPVGTHLDMDNPYAETEIYIKDCLSCGGKDKLFYFYRHQSCSDAQVLKNLLKHYKRGGE